MILKLPLSDLSMDTLIAIKRDLFKYSHLSAYKADYKELCSYIEARAREEKRLAKNERGNG